MEEKQRPSKRGGSPGDSTEIAWQNKDIISKLFGESLKGKSLSVYGIRNSGITDVRPTNLPAIEANELRLDNLFLMEDGAYAIVDYESEYSDENKVKYLGYIARVSKRLYTEYGELKPLRMIVIYTADVEPGSTDPDIDMGAFHMKIEEAFLIGRDSVSIRNELTDKADRGESFTDEDASRITRRLDMTKIGRILQEREDKAIAAAVAETKKEVKKQAKEEKRQSALKFLKTGDSVEKVSECMGMTLKEVQALAAKV